MIQVIIVAAGAIICLFLTGNTIGEISEVANLKSGLLVLGGTLMCAFLAFPVKTFRGLIKSLMEVFRYKETNHKDLLFQIESLAHVRWLYGIRELEEDGKRTDNPFLRRGIELVVDDYDRYEIRDIMEKDYELYFSNKASQVHLLRTLAKLAPAFGFIGTIIGLISVLNNMGVPAEIGKGMSLALLTTLYGSLISNFLFLPLAKKLSEHTKAEITQLNIIMEGVMDISDKRNPKAISHRLQGYLGLHDLTRADGLAWSVPRGWPILRSFAHKFDLCG
ncbi:MAG TPA: flagellar motor component [Desulfobacteraceae bacterium]|nr:flagellar motor component [Desulfobacteraceae bacterium]